MSCQCQWRNALVEQQRSAAAGTGARGGGVCVGGGVSGGSCLWALVRGSCFRALVLRLCILVYWCEPWHGQRKSACVFLAPPAARSSCSHLELLRSSKSRGRTVVGLCACGDRRAQVCVSEAQAPKRATAFPPHKCAAGHT